MLAKAPVHSPSPRLTHRLREQARSHSKFVVCPEFHVRQKTPVGASLLAKAAAHPPSPNLTHRFRERAHSYRGFVVVADFVYGRETCGSELAREDGGTPTLT